MRFLLASLSIILTLFFGCQPNSCLLEPKVEYTPSTTDITEYPSAFPSLEPRSFESDWGKELRIGVMFAKELDYYRAIGCWKRALILLPASEGQRRMQIEYNILQAYFLAGKYPEVITTFERSSLIWATATFPAFGDMLVMLHEAYNFIDQQQKAEKILEVIETGNSSVAEKLSLGLLVRGGRLELITSSINKDAATEKFLACYQKEAKSVKKAQLLNAIIPGAGYAYVGQHKSALTSFIINTLFIAATCRLAERGHIAAACITAGFEFGWYAGGINGAGLAAKEYNQRLYNILASNYMRKEQLFPIFLIETRF